MRKNKKKIVYLALLCMLIQSVQVVPGTWMVAYAQEKKSAEVVEAAPEEEYDYTVSEDGVTINLYLGENEKVVIPDTIEGYKVTEIADEAFKGNNNITEVILPDGITSIGDSAFFGCENLTAVTLPKKMTSIGNEVFSGCYSLKEMTLPEEITSMGTYIFYECSSLTHVTLPQNITRMEDGTFNGCINLAEITLPEGITSIGENAFTCCESLTELIIPESVTSIDHDAFVDCSGLTELILPDGITNIEMFTFSFCSNITKITLPKGVTSIGSYAFSQCINLKEIVLSEELTSVGFGAFSNCNSLTEIELPDSVTTIEDWAFSECSSLTKVTMPKGITSIGQNLFYKANANVKIYGYANTLAESYAKENEIEFVLLYEDVDKPTEEPENSYIGDVNTELQKFSYNNDTNYLSGQIVVVEWVDTDGDGIKESTVPKYAPKMQFVSTDGTETIDVFVTATGTNTYYFDRLLSGLTEGKEYVFKVTSGNPDNVSQYKTVPIYTGTSAIGSEGVLGKVGNQKLCYSTADDGTLILSGKQPEPYNGNVNSLLTQVNYGKSEYGDFITGNIIITEWIDGVSTVPETTPKMTFESYDGTEVNEVFMACLDGTNTYYFDRSLNGNVDTTKEYIFRITLTEPNNVSEYKSMVATTNEMSAKEGVLWETDTQVIKYKTVWADMDNQLRVYAVNK